jgi:hypothetical protein
MINRGIVACQIEVKTGRKGPPGRGQDKSAGIQLDLFSQSKRELRKILSRGLSGRQKRLISKLRRRRSLRHEGQVEVVDDSVHDGLLC